MRHHWVQESYLKAWCDPDTPDGHEPYVWVFEKDARLGKRRAPRKLFRSADLYKDRRGKADLDPQWLESGLSRIEGEFIRVRDQVIAEGQAVSQEDQAVLATYVGLSFVRTPKYIEFAAAPWRRAVRVEPKSAMSSAGGTTMQWALRHAARVEVDKCSATCFHSAARSRLGESRRPVSLRHKKHCSLFGLRA